MRTTKNSNNIKGICIAPATDTQECNALKQKSLKAYFTRIIAAAALGTSLMVSTAYASQGFEMSTDYPGITAKPGETINFNLDFVNETSQGLNTALSASGLDESWSGYFSGNDKAVSNVYVKTNSSTKGTKDDPNADLVTYSLTVPDDAKKGTYTVSLNAKATQSDLGPASPASSNLTLTINVSDESSGSSELTTTYPEQQGATGTTFTFNSTLKNNSSSAQSYSLAAEAPTGWTVGFKPSSAQTQVSSLDVDAHGSQGLTITVTPPDKVTAGDYEIPITANSADQSLSTTLKVTITGTYAINLSTTEGQLSFDANVNKKQTVPLNIVNTGNIDLNNVNLTTTAPSGWTVEFNESTIDTLPAGQTKEVIMYVTPSKDAMSGDYAMTVSAGNDETSMDQSFRVTVKTPTMWGAVGILLIVAVVCVLGEIFHKYGRH